MNGGGDGDAYMSREKFYGFVMPDFGYWKYFNIHSLPSSHSDTSREISRQLAGQRRRERRNRGKVYFSVTIRISRYYPLTLCSVQFYFRKDIQIFTFHISYFSFQQICFLTFCHSSWYLLCEGSKNYKLHGKKCCVRYPDIA